MSINQVRVGIVVEMKCYVEVVAVASCNDRLLLWLSERYGDGSENGHGGSSSLMSSMPYSPNGKCQVSVSTLRLRNEKIKKRFLITSENHWLQVTNLMLVSRETVCADLICRWMTVLASIRWMMAIRSVVLTFKTSTTRTLIWVFTDWTLLPPTRCYPATPSC